MKDNTPSLEVKEDGTIWLIPECPVEPNYIEKGTDGSLKLGHFNVVTQTYDYDKKMAEYKHSLASAGRLLVSNQDVAVKLITDHPNNKGRKNSYSPGIYPIPDLKWEVKDVPIERDPSTFTYYEREAGRQLVTEFTKVAILL